MISCCAFTYPSYTYVSQSKDLFSRLIIETQYMQFRLFKFYTGSYIIDRNETTRTMVRVPRGRMLGMKPEHTNTSIRFREARPNLKPTAVRNKNQIFIVPDQSRSSTTLKTPSYHLSSDRLPRPNTTSTSLVPLLAKT